MSLEWYYVAEGEARGPLPEGEIIHLIRNGEVKANTLVWTEGMQDWAPASDHFETRRRFGPPSPPRGGAQGAASGPWRNDGGARQRAAGARASHTGPDGLYGGAPSRGFSGAVSACLRRYFGFSGRASRSEFWYFVLFGFLASFTASILDVMLFGVADETAPLSALVGLGLFFPQLAVTFRRLHDTGRSGWWVGWVFFGPLLVTLAFAAVSGGGVLVTPDAAMGLMLLFMIGWFAIFLLILIFLCQRGDPGPNRYG
ncbi:DUF805 domain-containing protein [Alkalilacustris brevis]|uniref:DUF805 domain-containing protein n=1 Tax=Alkalilacustris brevis TaxID=2026338 RepID=UPI000E0D1016|nr:DUF805 domain-containing protein [Alkalilacustris brevis]